MKTEKSAVVNLSVAELSGYGSDGYVRSLVDTVKDYGERLDQFLQDSTDSLAGSPFKAMAMAGKTGAELTPQEVAAITDRLAVLGSRVLIAREQRMISRRETDSGTAFMAIVFSNFMNRFYVVEPARDDNLFRDIHWPGIRASDKFLFKTVQDKITKWHNDVENRVGDKKDALQPYDGIMNSAYAMSLGPSHKFFFRQNEGIGIARKVLLERYASFPMYVSLLAITDVKSEAHAAAVQYLQCNQAMLQYLRSAAPDQMPKDVRPSWWHKALCAKPEFGLTKKELTEIRTEARKNDTVAPHKDLEFEHILTLNLQLSISVLLCGSIARCVTAGELLSADKIRPMAPQKSLDSQILCVDATDRRLPHQVMEDIAVALQSYRDMPQLHKDLPEQYKVLSQLYVQAVELDSESRAEGELNARIVYLCAHDAAIMNLAQQANLCISALEPAVKSLKNALALIEGEAKSAGAISRKARKTAAKNRKVESLSANDAQLSKAQPITAWDDVLAPMPMEDPGSLIKDDVSFAEPGWAEAVQSLPTLATSVGSVSQSDRLAMLLQSVDTMRSTSVNAAVRTVTIGGIGLPTRLSTQKLSQVLDFVSAATFERLSWMQNRTQFNRRYSPAAYALRYHINKHFPHSSEVAATSGEQMTVEEYIRGALQVAHGGLSAAYLVPSAADVGKKVRKFHWDGYFAILGLDNRVISYGVDQGRMF